MRFPIHYFLIPLFVLGCSEDPRQSGVQDFPNTLQTSANTALFDLPTSIAAEQPEVAMPVDGLGRIAATTLDSDLKEAFGAYLAVPIFIRLAEDAKEEVRKLVIEFSKLDLPAEWEGVVDDSLYAITRTRDTVVEGKTMRWYALWATQKGELRLSLRFLRDSSDRYRGVFYMANPEDYHARVRVEFDQIRNDGQLLRVDYQRDSSGLEKQSDPTLIRIRALQRSAERMVVSGYSYHPAYNDEFWGKGARIYGFRSVTASASDKSLLRVGFARVDSLDGDFFETHSLDKEVLARSTESFRQTMIDSAGMDKLVYFSLDSNLTANEVLNDRLLQLIAYVPTRTPQDFTSADLMKFLALNRADILDGSSKLAGLRGLYLLVHIQQPLFLNAQATVVAAGDSIAPADFPLEPTVMDEEDYGEDSAEDLVDWQIVE